MKRRYGNGLIGTTATRIAECGPNEGIAVNSFWLCNTTGSNRTFTIYHTPAGEAPADNNALINGEQIRTGVSKQIEGPVYLTAGEQLWALSDAVDAVNVFAYAEVYPL